MIEMLKSSGFLGIVLVLLALLALALVVERLLAFSREATNMELFSRPFTEAVEARRFAEAAEICERHRGHIAEVYRVAVQHFDKGAASLRNILASHVELIVMPRLRARLKFLGAIGRGAPMIGLLGTVFGMMQAFQVIAGGRGAGADPKQMAEKIGLALGTTFLGLVVAIMIVFVLTYLRARVEQFEVDLERYTDHCVDLLYSATPISAAGLASDAAPPTAAGVVPVAPPPPVQPAQPIRRQS